MSDATTRRCRGCLAVQPEDQFNGRKTCVTCRGQARGWRGRIANLDCQPGEKRCPMCKLAKPEAEFDGRQNCNPCREMRNAGLRKLYEDAEYRARDSKKQKDYNRKVGRVAASLGEAMTTTCRRCATEFTYPLGRRRRTVCNLCRGFHEEWRSHGLTGAEAAQLRALKNCAICGATESGVKDRAMRIDHCHKTGAIRGILCHPCNAGLGMFRDDPDRLRAAAVYLEASRASTTTGV